MTRCNPRGGAPRRSAIRTRRPLAPDAPTSYAARERLGDRVDRQVTGAEISLKRLSLQRRAVDLPATIGAADAPGAELVGEREDCCAGRSSVAQLPRCLFTVTINDQVYV